MNSNTSVRFRFVFKGERAARAVEEGLRPDNVNFPEGFSMNQYVDGREFYIEFYSKGKIETLLNTVDEVLASISAMVGTLRGD